MTTWIGPILLALGGLGVLAWLVWNVAEWATGWRLVHRGQSEDES